MPTDLGSEPPAAVAADDSGSPIEPVLEARPPLWAFLPCAVLVAVAVVQIATALTKDLTPWKGGGFGMFSTADTGMHRQVRAYAVFDDGERLLSLRGRDLRKRAMLNYPTEERVGAYANWVAVQMERRRPPPRAIRLELWRSAFHPEPPSYRGELWHEYLLELQRPEIPAGRGR